MTPEVVVPADTVAPAEAEVKEDVEVASVARKKLFTPSMPGSAGRFAVPALGGLSLITALVALELTKRPRRLDGADSGVSTPNTGLTP